ncbi:MAG: sigma-70 family RNA polymerase sigma factor [Desulfomonile tiedjei]|uniref:Sigma-70 family RNA polymerase sigma factor n=1 Tax=Desulfomonile tiedjei TaxID=2358 RepID=A0A9D6V4L6_9BACT|nr:sigma-70 family RNA polymerase sigma factor [Desulfomonile tiedjei]
MHHLSDKDLLEALANGDEAAFSVFVNRYLAPVFRFALRLTNDEFLAEDVSQEVFLRIYQRAWEYDARFPVKNWVLAVVRNTGIDIVRSRKSWIRAISELHTSSSESELMTGDQMSTVRTPEEQLSKAEESKRILDALQVLPENQKTAIILQYYEGLTVKEIANVMQISVSAVESLLVRAKRNLGKFLSV